MHCALPLPELLCSSPMATVSNAKAFSHAELKLSLFNNKRVVAGWRFYVQLHTRFKSAHAICALATVEREALAPSSSSESQIVSELNFGASQDVSEEDPDLEEREKLRRTRISSANKGNTPWNKGKKHSPETLQRIRERTKIAMQNPKVKMKLINMNHPPQSEKTRVKIGEGVREGWRRRREKQMIQEGCHLEWCNMIAEAARVGFYGEGELLWDSYELLREELEWKWAESVKRRKSVTKQSMRAPKPLEQRRKLAETIRAMWADPGYRERVHSGIIRHHQLSGTELSGTEKKQRKKPERTSSSKGKSSTHSESVESEIKSLKVPKKTKKVAKAYKDPMVSTKLEMIKKIKDERLARESKKSEAVNRAKLLIAEAEKATKALAAAALTNPLALDSLMEARSLIAKAIQMLDSIEEGPLPANSSSSNISSPDSDEVPTKLHINGKDTFNLDGSVPSRALNGSEEAINGRCLSVNGLVGSEEEEDVKSKELEPSRKVKKKQVSERLIEVEGD